jgi:hypothetical protein
MWKAANAEQEERRLIHPIETRLTELLEGVEVGFIANSELRRALDFKVGRTEIRQQKLADDTMQRLGWRRLGNALKAGRYRARGWAKGDDYREHIFRYQGEGSDFEAGRFVATTLDEVRQQAEADDQLGDF